MNAEEKWSRLTSPKSIEDYGLCVTRNEMLTFPEGKALVEAIDCARSGDEHMMKIAALFGRNAVNVIEREIASALSRSK